MGRGEATPLVPLYGRRRARPRQLPDHENRLPTPELLALMARDEQTTVEELEQSWDPISTSIALIHDLPAELAGQLRSRLESPPARLRELYHKAGLDHLELSADAPVRVVSLGVPGAAPLAELRRPGARLQLAVEGELCSWPTALKLIESALDSGTSPSQRQ